MAANADVRGVRRHRANVVSVGVGERQPDRGIVAGGLGSEEERIFGALALVTPRTSGPVVE
jgi:hypothetical protein